MPVIKRYPNRKLYDTEAKQYVTLDQIAELIRAGEDVQVVDNATGEDLTALTLSQIIFEQEKKQSGFLPRSLLSGLIQSGGSRLSALQRTVAVSLGFSNQVDDEIRRRVDLLVAEEMLTHEEGEEILEKLLSAGARDAGEAQRTLATTIPSEKRLEKLLSDLQIPTRSDLQDLLEQLDQLNARIDEIGQENPND